MRPGESLLIICHSFPPNTGIGGRRWVKFAKELARRGHPVHVIRNEGRPGRMDSLWAKDAETPGIIAHPLPQRYPTVLIKGQLSTFWDKLMYHFWLRVLPLATRGNYYDHAIFWKQQLLGKAEQLITEKEIRNVIVTGAPFSLLVHATELKSRFPHIHLVADIRDPWTWGNSYGFQAISKERLEHERRNEALVAKVYDKLIAPSASVVEHLREAHQGEPGRYAVIPHVIDPDETELPQQRTSDGIFRIIYAGSLYDRTETDLYFTELLKAFQRLEREHPENFRNCRLDLYITGHGTTEYEQAVQDHGLQEVIHFHPPAPPKVILEQIAGADLVLAFISSDKKDIMVTKLNEIFYLRRPVLHIGEPGLVSRTIVEGKLGASLRVEELEAELPRIIVGERQLEVDQRVDHSHHLLAHITDRLVRDVLV